MNLAEELMDSRIRIVTEASTLMGQVLNGCHMADVPVEIIESISRARIALDHWLYKQTNK